jgi:predicted nucleotidyltransferase component of viral defense system
MELNYIDKIKRLAIIAMVSDDYLLGELVLKGGNAIDVIYKISGRASIDLDYSIPDKSFQINEDDVRDKIFNSLTTTFSDNGYTVFDIKFTKKPENIGNHDEMDFWGGYQIEFKIIPSDIFNQYKDEIKRLRNLSIEIEPHGKKTFKIDIGKFEYCKDKVEKQIDGYTLYVYSTEMLVLEKIRAICQQIPEYRDIVRSHAPSPRARDFFDIYIITQNYPIDLSDERIVNMLEIIFDCKKVPLNYISRIPEQREFHRQDFPSLKDTVIPEFTLQEFDFYFDYVVSLVQPIIQKPLG